MKTAMADVWSYIRQYRFNSILWHNFVLIMLLIIVPLVSISLIVYTHNDADMRAEIERSALSELGRTRDSVDMILFDAEQLSVRLKSDPDVEAFQNKQLSSPLTYAEAQMILRIQQVLQMVKLTSSYIDSIFLYSAFNDYLITAGSGGTLSDQYYDRWPHIYKEKSDSSFYWVTSRAPSGKVNLLSFVNQVSPSITERNNGGAVSINMNMNSMRALLDHSPQQQSILLLNGQGRIMYSGDGAKLNRTLAETDPDLNKLLEGGFSSRIISLDGQDQVVSSMTSNSIKNWKYVSVVPLQAYHAERSRIIELMVVLLSVSALASIILAFIIAVRSYRPIRQILSLIEHKKNPFMMLNKVPSNHWNETGYILSNLADSFHQSHSFEVQLQEKYELLRKAQAIALQAQINPHFLFNTLESINWKVMRLTNGKNEASQMLLSLSALLRLTLETKEDLVPIRMEMEHVRLYVEMQQLRYKDKFSLDIRVEDNLLECRIVKLVLQPIVENAIYFGIKQSPNQGIIRIRMFLRGDMIVVRVMDNGVGIPPLTVLQLNESFRREHLQENEHIGLRNVNQRIRLAFGEQYGLKIRSRVGAGTIVDLTLPEMKILS